MNVKIYNFKKLNRENKNQNIRILKIGKKINKESRSLNKNKFKNEKNEDFKNKEENNN